MHWLGTLAAKKGTRCYLVGGAVRDRFLGRSTRDIDIACEGDIRQLGKKIALALKSDFAYYSVFRTGTIESPAGLRIDIAQTRRERYPEQGKLPEVISASIKDDLFRRDFTINAIARSLNSEDFGRVIDPVMGREDIKKGLIRVLHKNSFADDPTRIFRAVRYAERLGFKIEDETLRFLKKYIARIQALSGERLLYELRCIAKESRETRVKIIKKLDSLKILGFLGIPHTSLSPIKLSRIDETDTCEFLCLFLSFYREVKVSRLPLSKQCTSTIHTLRRSEEISNCLKKMTKPSEITSYLNKFDERGLRILSLIDKKASSIKIERYLTDYKKTKVAVTGDDLKKLGMKPGPGFREILDSLLSSKLDGNIKGKKEEIRMVKTLIKTRD